MGASVFRVIKEQWQRALTLMGVGVASLLLVAAPGASADGVPVKVRFGGDTQSTRVVLDVAQSVEAREVAGNRSRQIVLEFPRLTVDASSGRGQGLVGEWNLQRVNGATRLTLNLSGDAEVDRRFLLAPADGVAFYRYVIDIKSAQTGRAATPQVAAAPRVTPTPVARNTKRVIVIDAGHGGSDPGALGANAKEKEITLAAAKALKTKLERTGRYTVVLTRENDTYVGLEQRVQISRRAQADLFISLHADAGENHATRGASVYTLSDRGSDRVAAGSNSNWAINVDGVGGDQSVRQILFDLTQRNTRNKSAEFAEMLIQNVGSDRPLLTRAHRDAGYVVLFAPDVPAVLLEMGFITNTSDEETLLDARKRDALADSIVRSIDAYFSRNTLTAST